MSGTSDGSSSLFLVTDSDSRSREDTRELHGMTTLTTERPSCCAVLRETRGTARGWSLGRFVAGQRAVVARSVQAAEAYDAARSLRSRRAVLDRFAADGCH